MAKMATPRARAIANEHNVDLEKIKGTGKSGYVVPADVEKYIQAKGKTNGRAAKEPQPPLDMTMKEKYEYPLLMASDDLIEALKAGVVLPTSVIDKLRFRDDDHEGNYVGNDILGIRPAVIGGAFRSQPGIVAWYVADRGYFDEAPEESEPQDAPALEIPDAKVVDPGTSSFEVTKA